MLTVQESRDRQALWVAPQSLADIEDEVVRTVQSTIMTDRGVDVRRDLQVQHLLLPVFPPIPQESAIKTDRLIEFAGAKRDEVVVPSRL